MRAVALGLDVRCLPDVFLLETRQKSLQVMLLRYLLLRYRLPSSSEGV